MAARRKPSTTAVQTPVSVEVDKPAPERKRPKRHRTGDGDKKGISRTLTRIKEERPPVAGDDDLLNITEDMDDVEADRIRRSPVLQELADQTPVISAEKALAKAAKGKTREKILQRRKFVMEAQTLLMLNIPASEVARQVQPRWKKSLDYCRKLIQIAKKHNLEHLARNPAECKADSLKFWSTKLQEAETRRQRGYREIEKGNQIVASVQPRIDSAHDPEVIHALTKLLDRGIEIADHGRRMVTSGEYSAERVQDRIDRLLGNYAPERIALTTADGEDVLHKAPPMTPDQARTALFTMLTEAAALLSPQERSSLKIPDVLTIDQSPKIPMRIVEEEE